MQNRAWCNSLRRNWIPHLGTNVAKINNVSDDELVSILLDKHKSAFNENNTKHIGPAVHLELTNETKPKKFFKARSIPVALRCAVETKLDRLQGTMEPTQHFDFWNWYGRRKTH